MKSIFDSRLNSFAHHKHRVAKQQLAVFPKAAEERIVHHKNDGAAANRLRADEQCLTRHRVPQTLGTGPVPVERTIAPINAKYVIERTSGADFYFLKNPRSMAIRTASATACADSSAGK